MNAREGKIFVALVEGKLNEAGDEIHKTPSNVFKEVILNELNNRKGRLDELWGSFLGGSGNKKKEIVSRPKLKKKMKNEEGNLETTTKIDFQPDLMF